jgi:hypothetical protein
MSGPERSPQLSDAGWSLRLRDDATRAIRNQSVEQRLITDTIMSRALRIGAEGFALTGSTARRRRTAISDLDYHVIGQRPDVSDLPGDVDIVAVSPSRFLEQLRDGDDYPQWTLRCGCILYDAGVMRDGFSLITHEDLWPNGNRKLASLADHRREVERLVRMGDRDAAQDQVRATLTTAARGLLLRAGVFPLARSELVGQLNHVGYQDLAHALGASIYQEQSLDNLAETGALLDRATEASRARTAA